MEVNPETMESLIVPGLFFAGEVLDVIGPCGGYNLQFAFSTGAIAGMGAGRPVSGYSCCFGSFPGHFISHCSRHIFCSADPQTQVQSPESVLSGRDPGRQIQ